jgi:hypothetical protein
MGCARHGATWRLRQRHRAPHAERPLWGAPAIDDSSCVAVARQSTAMWCTMAGPGVPTCRAAPCVVLHGCAASVRTCHCASRAWLVGRCVSFEWVGGRPDP